MEMKVETSLSQLEFSELISLAEHLFKTDKSAVAILKRYMVDELNEAEYYKIKTGGNGRINLKIDTQFKYNDSVKVTKVG